MVLSNVSSSIMNVSNQVTNGNFASSISSLKLGFLTDTTFFGNTLLQYVIFCIIIAVSFFLGKLIYYILKHKLVKVAEKTKSRLDDMLVKILQGPLVLAVVIVGFSYSLQVLSMPAELAAFFAAVTSVLISLVTIWLIMRLVDAFIDTYMRPYTEKTETELDEQLIPVIKKVLKAVVLIFGVISIVSNFGYDLTALITGLGIGGIAIALAAQVMLGDVFGGVSISMDRPFAVGDRVKVGEVYGDVVSVGMRSSRIQTLDNNMVIIPNSVLAKSIVENYAQPTKKLRQKFTIGLVYGTTPEKMEQAAAIIKDAIKRADGVTKDDPLVWFTNFGDYSLTLTCIYWIKSIDFWGATSHQINLSILRDFEKAGIQIAFPTQTIYLEK